MIPAPGVTFCDLDSADMVDDVLSVFMLLSDGSLVGVCLPIAELIRQGHTIVEAVDAPAFCVDPGAAIASRARRQAAARFWRDRARSIPRWVCPFLGGAQRGERSSSMMRTIKTRIHFCKPLLQPKKKHPVLGRRASRY